jgi:tetratricopeptide (TPR) repeat protein
MRKRCFAALLVMFFLVQGTVVFASAPGNRGDENTVPKKALRLVKKADKALADKKYDKALDGYNKAIEIAPGYAAAHFGMGRALVQQQKFDQAVVSMEKAVKLDPDAAEAKLFFGKVLLKTGSDLISQRQFRKANDYFLKIFAVPGIENLEEGKLYREGLFETGFNYSRLKDYARSNEYFQKLVGLPGVETADKKLIIQALYQVGINYFSLRKAKESNEYFLKLLQYPEVETDFPQVYISVYYLLGINANIVKDYEKSIGYFVKFLELGETSSAHSQLLPVVNLLLGANHMSLLRKDTDKILHDKEQKGKKDKIAELAKNKKNIETYLKKAIQLQGNLEIAYMHLGNYYYYCSDLDNAVATYQELVEKFPSSADLSAYKEFLEKIKKEKQDSSK